MMGIKGQDEGNSEPQLGWPPGGMSWNKRHEGGDEGHGDKANSEQE